MSDKPGEHKIDWKKRLEAIKYGPVSEPSRSVVTPTQPLVQEVVRIDEVPSKPLAPETDKVQEVKPEVHDIKPVQESQQQPPVSLPNSQEGRLDRLEQQLRSLKVMGAMAFTLVIFLLLGFGVMVSKALRPPGGISAGTLTIKDGQGICRAWMGVRDGQVRVELRDQAGRQRLNLGLGVQGEPNLVFYNKDQKILGEIAPLPDGQPGINLLNPVSEIAPVNSASGSPSTGPETQVVVPSTTPVPDDSDHQDD